MKKTRILTVMLGITAGLGLLSLAACKPDGPTATLTLSAGEGGTLTKTEYEVEVGASLAEYLKSVKVTPEEGLTFAGWYNGSTPISTETMPEGGLSLTAKYNVPYTLNLYLADVSGAYGEATTTQETAIYGEAFTYSPSTAHYTLDTEKENKLSSEKLGKGESFTVYLKRETYGVNYYLNAPAGEDGFDGAIEPSYVVYGTEITVASGDALTPPEWFRFAGWATDADGKVVYKSGEKVAPESDLFLYAVWDEAYYDRFGGGDFVFFPQTEEGVAILRRAGQEHVGAHDGNNFSFKAGDEEIVKGKVSENGTFIYCHEEMKGEVYHRYNNYTNELHEEASTIEFDDYGNVTYTVDGTAKHGEASYDPATMYYTFSGDGEEFDFVLTEILTGAEGSSSEVVFVTVGAEADDYFAYEFYYEENAVTANPFMNTAFYTDLDGIGNVYCMDAMEGEIVYVGTYVPKAGGVVTLTLMDADGATLTIDTKLINYEGEKINVFGDGWEGSYTDAEGNTLVLDGFSGTTQSAVWTSKDGTTKKEGMYAVDYSPLGYILRLQEAPNKVTSYRISIDETFSELGDGSYREYILRNNPSALGGAVLVFGEDDAATLYPDARKAPDVKIEGKVKAVEGQEGLFGFTSETENFQFRLQVGYFRDDNKTRFYCHTFTYYSDPAEANMKVLSSAEKKIELRLDFTEGHGHSALLKTEGDSYIGLFLPFTEEFDTGYVKGSSYIDFYDLETGAEFYFEWDEKTSTIILLGEESGGYYMFDPDSAEGEVSTALYLFNGTKKNALWVAEDENGDTSFSYGTYTYDKATNLGVFTVDPASPLTIDDKPVTSLRFTLGADADGYPCFFPHNGVFDDDEMTFTGDGTLMLDAYGFGSYNGLKGNYIVVNSSQVEKDGTRIYFYAYTQEGIRDAYFDIFPKTKTYTECGYEVGRYYEDIEKEDILIFDGYGKVTRHNINHILEDGETLETLEEGTYSVVDLDEGIILVKFAEESYQVQVYSVTGDENLYYTKEVGSEGSYVSDKWEYLTIDTFGEAVYTDEYGVSYKGTVTQVTEHVVSFAAARAQGSIYCELKANGSFSVPESGMIIDGDTLVKYLGGMGAEIKIPDGVKKIAPLAFSEHLYGSAYLGADITSLDLNEVEEIGDNAFNGCSLLKSVKGDNLKTVGENVFYACIELVSLTLPKLEEIGEMAFHLCESLKNVTLEGAKVLRSSAFSDCYELTEVSLPAAEKLYEGVFFDCYALRVVTLGANLTQIGTPDEVVAGVFERYGIFEQAPLKVVFEGAAVPTVGKQLFQNVNSYTIVVKDIATVKAFYLADGWADYNAHVGCESEYDGTYSTVNARNWAFEILTLNGIATYENVNGSKTFGAYEIGADKMLTVYTFDPAAANHYTSAVCGEVYEGGIKFDVDSYGADFKDYWSDFAGPDKEYTLVARYNEGETLSFTLTGDLSAIPATFANAEGVGQEVTLIFTRDGNGKMALYFELDGMRYVLDVYSEVMFEYTKSFAPIITTYEAADGSVLILSQEDKEGTKFTVYSILAGLPNIEEFRLENVEPVWTGENTFTVEVVSDEISYRFTFVLGDGTFSYTYTADGITTLFSEDGNMRLVLSQNANGKIVSMVLSKNTSSDPENANWLSYSASFFVSAPGGGYYYYVCDGNNYARFKIALALEGKEVTGFTAVESGKAFWAYSAGMYAFLYFDENGGYDNYALYLRDDHVIVAHTTGATVEGNLLTVVVEGGNYANTYYITFDAETEDATLVPANEVYESNEYSDLKGTVLVVKNPDGTTKSVTLTMGDKSYTTFSEYQDEYGDPYWTVTNGTDYYYVTVSSNGCRISALSAKAFTSGEFTITLLVQSNNEVVGVASATYQNKAVVVTFESDYISGKDCALLSFTVGDVTKNYLANITDSAMAELEEHILTTSDGKYRVTVLTSGNDFVYGVTKFEEKDGDGFKELTITWSSATEGDGYNFQFGTDTGSYDFNIVKVGNDWTATLVNEYHW